MSSRRKQTSSKRGVQKGDNQVAFEQQDSIEENLLPPFEELKNLQTLDPNIIQWIKDRTEKEQDARLDFNDRRMGLVEKGQKMGYRMDMTTVICALIVILSGMLFSFFLILNDKDVLGTIFAGGTILFSVYAFLNFRRKKNSIKNN